MGIGGGQLLIIVVLLVVLFFAPSRISELGKSLAQAIRGFRKGMAEDETDVTHSVKREKLEKSSVENIKETKVEKEQVK